MFEGAHPRHLTAFDNPLLVRLRKTLRDPTAYRKGVEIWLEGEHLCAACIEQGLTVPHALVTEAAWGQPALQALARQAMQVSMVSGALMRGLSNLESPAVIGFVLPAPRGSELKAGVPTLVLDRLQDPGNVGALLRSAAAFAFTQVLALKGTVALWSPKVLRAAMGAHFSLNLCELVAADALGALAVPCLASSPHAAQVLHEVVLPWPCAWVLGHEGQGIASEVAGFCERQLRIAQPGGQESLNVAVAGAVCLYESVRQRSVRSESMKLFANEGPGHA